MLNTNLLLEDAKNSIVNVPVEKLHGKHVVVTGGSGLIGTHMLYGLYACQMMDIDVKVTYTTNTLPPSYLKTLPFQHIMADLTLPEAISLFPADSVDIVIHCATYGQPGKFLEDEIKTIALNTSTLMSLAENLQPEKLLFISTSELYSGLYSDTAYKESEIGTTNTDHPRACYIEGKRCGEAICNSIRKYGMDAKSARLCLAYGPGTKVGDKRVLNSFIEKALKNKKIEMMDSGQSLRTYGYVSDCIYMLWRILLSGTQPVYNVGGISNVTIKQLADTIGSLLNVPVIMPETIKEWMIGTPASTQLDLSRFTDEFGKMKFVGIEDGLQRTIDWQKGLYL